MELYQPVYTLCATASVLSGSVILLGMLALIIKRAFLTDAPEGGAIHDRLAGHSRGAR